VVDKLPETPAFGTRGNTWEATHDQLVRSLYDMMTRLFYRVNRAVTRDDEPHLFAVDYGVSASATAAVNTAAINAAMDDAVVLGKRRIYLPAGQLNFNAWDSVTDNAMEFYGMGDFTGGTELRFAHATGDSIVFSGGQHNALRDVFITSSVYKTSGYAIKIAGGAYTPRIENIRIDLHHNGIWVGYSAETYLRRIRMRYMHGTQGIYVAGTSAALGVFGCTADYFNADNPYPQTYGTFKTWTTTTAFSLNDIIQNNGNIYQCSTARTSAGSGTGPSGIPGSGTSDAAFTTAITDNTARWKYVASGSLVWFLQDNYAYSCACNDSALLNGGYGYRMIDSANTGSSYPMWFNSTNLELDHNLNMGAELAAGEGFFVEGFWQGSVLAGPGTVFGASFRGEASIGAGSRIWANYTHGITVAAGPAAINISDSVIGLNGQATANTYDNINLAASAARVIISNNFIGTGASSGQARYGVFGGAGVGRIIIEGNDLGGNVTAGTNLATGGTIFVENNNV